MAKEAPKGKANYSKTSSEEVRETGSVKGCEGSGQTGSRENGETLRQGSAGSRKGCRKENLGKRQQKEGESGKPVFL